ncbi:GSCFA domain-containing protein, partial [Seonamhaeicola marinus]
IWEAFKYVWISEKAVKTMENVDAIQKGLQHKPFNPNSEAHKKFLQKLESKKQALSKSFPHMSF